MGLERFRFSSVRERWLEFLGFEHPVLPAPIELDREGDELLVRRSAGPRRRIRDGRVPDERVPELFLQAAAIVAALQAAGFWASAADLLDASWDAAAGRARLFLDRTPAGVTDGSPATAAEALAPFLGRISRRSGRIRQPAAAALEAALAADGAARRRADFWVASAYAAWDSLGSGAAAPTRLRTLGFPGVALRSAWERARIEQARAVLENRKTRLFAPAGPCLVPGEAVGLPGEDLENAIRSLRAGLPAAGGAPPLWICTGRERWDALSHSALSAVAVGRESIAPEVLWISDSLPRPARPDEWRAEISVSCGTMRASLRFHERIAGVAAAGEVSGREAAERLVAHTRWAAFVSDPTGDAPLPPVEVDLPGAPVRPARASGRGRVRCGVPPPGDVRREELERGLEACDAGAALAAALAWKREVGDFPVERWFELSARLCALVRPPRPAWLEALEAERELAGGRLAPAEACLSRIAASPDAARPERRAAWLRLAEVSVARGKARDAADAANRWRAAYEDAPPDELVRALLLEGSAASREGDMETARTCLDDAEAQAESLDSEVRVRVLLARADAYARAGLLAEEAACYERARSLLRAVPDEALGARVLAREALGMADRREFDGALARLEEARRILRDDPAESARLAIDIAATLYHAGRTEKCVRLLGEAAELSVAAGREDLARIARGNLVEAALASEDWPGAAAGIEALLASARRDDDATWILVALHHRARLALRQGRLSEAERDNRQARALAADVGDRLEIGELWLEEGDRLALSGDPAAAAAAYRRAAEDPPDRCDTSRHARERIGELEAWERGGSEGEAEALAEAAASAIGRGEFASAEAVARWAGIAPDRVPAGLKRAAATLLERRGATALARMCRPPSDDASPGWDAAGLRALRETIAGALAGEELPVVLPLGLTGIVLSASSGQSAHRVLRLGAPFPDGGSEHPLDAGADQWRLCLFPPLQEPTASAAVLLLESLLFRLVPADSSPDCSEGWRRLGVVASDRVMEEPYRRLRRFAPKSMTVLILGESGSGKEAVARAVHGLSPRSSGPFVGVNVSAIPSALVESELFGHARGSFTGADRDRPGLLEEASRGTIFFDEIGDLAAPIQAKLLRTLQDREIRRVGENRSRRIDVRVVSATSRDLEREVEEGRFREDLYYRLHVAVIRLPPLRERGRDAILLARHFLLLAAKEDGLGAFDIEPDAVAAILAHPWPGNVRELQSAMASAAALCDGRRIGAALLPEAVRRAARPDDSAGGYRSRVDAHRRDLIMEALDRAGGNRSRAARDLRLSRQALLYLIRELKVTSPPRTSPPRSE